MKRLAELKALVSDLPENSRSAYERNVLGGKTLTSVVEDLKRAVFWKRFWSFCFPVVFLLYSGTLVLLLQHSWATDSQDIVLELAIAFIVLISTILVFIFLSRKEFEWKQKVHDYEEILSSSKK